MKLSPKQIKELWGEEGPYSQAHLLLEERILDDSISRSFFYVETCINPTTFRFVKKYKKNFVQDKMVQAILNLSEYKNPQEGFVACLGRIEYVDEQFKQEAYDLLQKAREAVIRMHQFVMDSLAEKTIQ